MLKLKETITTYFPEEKILNESFIELIDRWEGPFGVSNYFYLTAIPMIETDTRYYFDRREAYLFTLRKYFFLSILGTTVFVLLLWVYVWRQTTESFFWSYLFHYLLLSYSCRILRLMKD